MCSQDVSSVQSCSVTRTMDSAKQVQEVEVDNCESSNASDAIPIQLYEAVEDAQSRLQTLLQLQKDADNEVVALFSDFLVGMGLTVEKMNARIDNFQTLMCEQRKICQRIQLILQSVMLHVCGQSASISSYDFTPSPSQSASSSDSKFVNKLLTNFTEDEKGLDTLTTQCDDEVQGRTVSAVDEGGNIFRSSTVTTPCDDEIQGCIASPSVKESDGHYLDGQKCSDTVTVASDEQFEELRAGVSSVSDVNNSDFLAGYGLLVNNMVNCPVTVINCTVYGEFPNQHGPHFGRKRKPAPVSEVPVAKRMKK
uniref:Uncharacterized protein n=1 Tax=Panagrolaimus superbus TaxID=310955 RepID=A0A914XX43_9BILA